MNNSILHNGVVEKTEPPYVIVRILQQSACSECHAKNLCSASESKVKLIQIKDQSGQYKVNEEVLICGNAVMGLKAVLLSFIIPLVLIIITLFTSILITENEIFSGIISLIILIPYYTVIFLIRNKLKKNFTFSLSKIN